MHNQQLIQIIIDGLLFLGYLDIAVLTGRWFLNDQDAPEADDKVILVVISILWPLSWTITGIAEIKDPIAYLYRRRDYFKRKSRALYWETRARIEDEERDDSEIDGGTSTELHDNA